MLFFNATGNNILCDGNYACTEASLNSTGGPVKCTGENSCEFATISTTKYVYLDGSYSGNCTNIYAPVVRAYGLGSIEGALIDSYGSDSLKVNAFGDQAGKDSTVICRSSTSKCKISCQTTGCRKMDLIIYGSGDNCVTDPKECSRGRNPAKIGEIYCPTITYVENDDELNQFLEQKRLKLIQQRQVDNEMFVDIDNSHQKEEINNNNNKKFVIARWDIRFFLCVALLIIGAIICYSGYDYYKLKNHDTSDYQYLK